MNVLADESVDYPIVARLRREGHHVLYVAEMELGIRDEVVLERANELNAMLLTADKDFGGLVYRQGRLHGGVILLRLEGLPIATKAGLIATAIRERGMNMLNAFSVVAPGQVRIRPRQ